MRRLCASMATTVNPGPSSGGGGAAFATSRTRASAIGCSTVRTAGSDASNATSAAGAASISAVSRDTVVPPRDGARDPLKSRRPGVDSGIRKTPTMRIGVPRRLLKRSRGAAFALVASGWLAWGPMAAAESRRAPDADPLQLALAAHPDDPALAWAWIERLARREPRAALEALDRFAARWPSQRPDVERTRGRLYYTIGEDVAALSALDRAVGERPD